MLQGLGIQEISAERCKKLVGVGTDVASANIAARGLKEEHLPWMFWTWCLAHRLELAINDALKGTAFDVIDEFLLTKGCIICARNRQKNVGNLRI